jgi:CDP-diacylglycerol--serine O-phosphatidyltransferase
LGASRGIEGADISWLVAVVVAGAGLLMVSSVKYHSFKEFHIGRVPFKVLLGVIIAFAIVFLDPPLVLLSVATIYVAVGLLMSLWQLRKH